MIDNQTFVCAFQLTTASVPCPPYWEGKLQNGKKERDRGI